jgi:hypothetical protein
MKTLLLTCALYFISQAGFSQNERNIPLFPVTDSLGIFGEWQTLKYKGDKGEEIEIACRFKVRKKFMLTCLYSVELRNDGEKDIRVHFLAGNGGTNYYSGQIGVVNEKVKLEPKVPVVVDYRLPTKTNSKEDTDAMVCRKCKELEHFFMFTK